MRSITEHFNINSQNEKYIIEKTNFDNVNDYAANNLKISLQDAQNALSNQEERLTQLNQMIKQNEQAVKKADMNDDMKTAFASQMLSLYIQRAEYLGDIARYKTIVKELSKLK